MTTRPMDISPTPSARPRRWGLRIGIGLVVIIVGWYLVLGIGVYSGNWSGRRTVAVLRITPLPVAMVGWRPLSYADYLDQRTAVGHYTAYLKSTTAGVYQAPTNQDPAAATLTKMVRLAVSERTIRRLGVILRPADVDQAYQAQLLQNGNVEQVKATIQQLYGWTPEAFKRNVIRPAVLRDKLQEKLSFDDQLSASAKAQADRVLALVRQGQLSFNDLAKTYSDDVYGAAGGDLGFVGQGEQVKEIDEVVFNLEVNQVSDLIHTKYGFHIIKPIERTTVDGREQVHLLQITILAPQVDAYLNTAVKSVGVQVWAPRLRWDRDQGRAVSSQP